MKKYCLFVPLIVLLAAITGCSTYNAVKQIPAPDNFEEALLLTHGQIRAARNMTVFALHNGVIPISRAEKVDEETRKAEAVINDIRSAYKLASGDLSQCKIVYAGAELPCESEQDRILMLLLTLQNELRPK